VVWQHEKAPEVFGFDPPEEASKSIIANNDEINNQICFHRQCCHFQHYFFTGY